MADLVTMIRRALGLELRPPEAVPPSEHDIEHDVIDRRLDRNELRIKAIDERIRARAVSRK